MTGLIAEHARDGESFLLGSEPSHLGRGAQHEQSGDAETDGDSAKELLGLLAGPFLFTLVVALAHIGHVPPHLGVRV